MLTLEGLVGELALRREKRYWDLALMLRGQARYFFYSEPKYQLACELADIAFALAHDPHYPAACRVNAVLMRVVDQLDLLEREDTKGAYGMCYLLMCLDPLRLQDGDRLIKFYSEAVEYVEQVPAYSGLLSALLRLAGEYPRAELLKGVRIAIEGDASIPKFDRDVAVFLLAALEQQAI